MQVAGQADELGNCIANSCKKYTYKLKIRIEVGLGA